MVKPRRFQAADWLDLGLQALSRHGAEAVKLDAICKAAALTKGSFYHHFADHNAFLVQMADRWLTRQTLDIIDTADMALAPLDKAQALTQAVMTLDFRLELGIREIAHRVPAVDALVKQADAVRLAALSDIYTARFGITPAQAKEMATLEYAMFNGLILIDPDMTPDAQTDAATLYEAMVTAFLTPTTG